MLLVAVLWVLPLTSGSEAFVGRNPFLGVPKNTQEKPAEPFDHIVARVYSRYNALHNAVKKSSHECDHPRSIDDQYLKTFHSATNYQKDLDFLAHEKLEVWRNHNDDLEKCKYLVQEMDTRYENLKEGYNKSLAKNRQLEETSNSAEQEVIKERLESAKFKNERDTARKNLDACRAQLPSLQQEKDNLQTVITEEIARNGIFEQDEIALTEPADEATKSKETNIVVPASTIQPETVIPAINEPDLGVQEEVDLQKLCQQQLYDAIQPEQTDYQELLFAANATFQAKIEKNQCVIAECAVRAINETLVEHQWEISKLKEYREKEKQLTDRRLVDLLKSVDWLEGALANRNVDIKSLTAKLRSVVEKHREEELNLIFEISGDS